MNSTDILLTLLLTAAIEFVTVVLRLVLHLKSAHVQKKIHWPRTHHSYVGVVILALAFLGIVPDSVDVRYVYVIGVALVLSDVIHHIAMVPLLRRYRYDVRMVHHEAAHSYLARWSALLLITIGIVALLTPFTPGSWLIPMGSIMLVGKRRTHRFSRSLLGRSLSRGLGM